MVALGTSRFTAHFFGRTVSVLTVDTLVGNSATPSQNGARGEIFKGFGRFFWAKRAPLVGIPRGEVVSVQAATQRRKIGSIIDRKKTGKRV